MGGDGEEQISDISMDIQWKWLMMCGFLIYISVGACEIAEQQDWNYGIVYCFQETETGWTSIKYLSDSSTCLCTVFSC